MLTTRSVKKIITAELPVLLLHRFNLWFIIEHQMPKTLLPTKRVGLGMLITHPQSFEIIRVGCYCIST